MTQLADELRRKHGALAGTADIAMLAYEELRRGKNPSAALGPFWDTVRSDAGLLLSFLALKFNLHEDGLKREALGYLTERRNEMDAGAGHQTFDAHPDHAQPASAPLPGEGQNRNDAQLSAAQTRQTVEREAGQVDSGSQHSSAPSRSPHDSGGGQDIADAHSRAAPFAVTIVDPSPARLMAERDAVKYLANASQREWLKVYRISGGLQPMHTAIANLANLRRRSVRDGTREFYDAVIIRALEKATAPYVEANPNATPADILSKEEIARIEDAVAFDKVKNRAAEWVRNFPELDVKQMEMADAV